MKIAIIGAAGTVGSCIAFALVNNQLSEEILLIDPFEDALKGHLIDISAVAAVQGIAVKKGSYADLPGTDIVVVAVGAPVNAQASRLELLSSSLPIIKSVAENINRYSPKAIVITETNPVDPLNYAMYLLSADKNRQRYIGYSLNDTLRFKWWAAEALGVNASRVSGMVIGEHGNSQVMLFSTLMLDGKPVELDAETKRKIQERSLQIIKLFEALVPKRTPGWTSAFGTAMVIEAIRNDSRTTLPCNAVLNHEYGLKGISTTVPLVLGKEGIESIKILRLAPQEKEQLESCVQTLKPHMQAVEDFVRNSSRSS